MVQRNCFVGVSRWPIDSGCVICYTVFEHVSSPKFKAILTSIPKFWVVLTSPFISRIIILSFLIIARGFNNKKSTSTYHKPVGHHFDKNINDIRCFEHNTWKLPARLNYTVLIAQLYTTQCFYTNLTILKEFSRRL